MFIHLADISIRAVILAFTAACVLWMMRRQRTAALEHAAWSIVVCGMLALFAFGEALPRLPLRILSSTTTVQVPSGPAVTVAPAIDSVLEQTPTAARETQATRRLGWRDAVLWTYYAVTLGFLVQFFTGMILAQRLVSTAN
jgi:hypothetical protein